MTVAVTPGYVSQYRYPRSVTVVTSGSAVCVGTPVFAFTDPVIDGPREWACSWCGSTNRTLDHLECRMCGAPRKPIA